MHLLMHAYIADQKFGEFPILARDGLSANDQKRTLLVGAAYVANQPPTLKASALRHC
jgi:hypothetical protein